MSTVNIYKIVTIFGQLLSVLIRKILPLRYRSTDVTALAPSAAAVITCLSCFLRTSPAANMPGILVWVSSPATIYPCSSCSIT